MSNAIYALLEVNSKILRKSTKKLEKKLATWFFYKVIHPRIQPKQLPRIIIQFLRETIGSLTTQRMRTFSSELGVHSLEPRQPREQSMARYLHARHIKLVESVNSTNYYNPG